MRRHGTRTPTRLRFRVMKAPANVSDVAGDL